MRIAYLAKRPIPSRNANSVQIMRMCEAFAQNGHQVTLYAIPGDAAEGSLHQRYGVERNFEIRILPQRRGPLFRWRFLTKMLRDLDSATDLFYGRDILSLAAVAHLGKPLIYEAHQPQRRGSLRARALAWLIARPNFSHLVCVTATLADQHRQAFPALAGKDVIAAPSPAAEFVEPERPAQLPGRADVVKVGFVGRPYPGKGIEEIVSAARELGGLDFHVVGASREELHWFDAVLPENVHLHGYRAPAELAAFYPAFDLVVAPYGTRVMNFSGVESAAITSPMKLVEYMAAGLPIVVSDLPGVREIADEGIALIVPAGDQQAFTAAVRRLAGDPELRRRLGAAARERHRERHTARVRARRVLGPLER